MSSRDGSVTITVQPNGALSNLQLGHRACELGPAGLTATIMETVREAQRQTARRVSDSFTLINGDGETAELVRSFLPAEKPTEEEAAQEKFAADMAPEPEPTPHAAHCAGRLATTHATPPQAHDLRRRRRNEAVVSTGFRVESEYLTKSADHLETLRDNIDSTAEVVGGCVGDVGLFGLVGQLFGAGASTHCDKARAQLNSYSENISRCADDLRQAARAYESGDDESELNISRYQL